LVNENTHLLAKLNVKIRKELGLKPRENNYSVKCKVNTDVLYGVMKKSAVYPILKII
jgi:hypothetical protein